MAEPEHVRLTYEDVHNLIKKTAVQIEEFKPDVLIAIGGGGFFPARVLRTFLKHKDTKKNIPIYAIGLSLYEVLPGTTAEQLGNEVIRTQWLGPETQKVLLGRRALIVDEIDDSRKTLQYALTELEKDAEHQLLSLPESERDAARTKFAVFVVSNKLKPKLGQLPSDIPYYAGTEVDDIWLDFPWEANDIEEHNRLAAAQKAKGVLVIAAQPSFSTSTRGRRLTNISAGRCTLLVRLRSHGDLKSVSNAGLEERVVWSRIMAEEVDYEALSPNAGLGVNMMAGALAGITEHSVMFPIDSIKTRMQVFSTTPAAVYTGIGNAVTRISSTEGLRVLWRGVSSVILGAGPAHAVHFGTYEAVKDILGGNRKDKTNQWLATSTAGAVATIASDALMNPFDVIKQRMQVHQSEFRSMFTCATTVWRNEGLSAFYVSYPTTLAMTVPFTAAQFTVYEQVKSLVNPTGEYSPASHMVAGGIAGAVAAGVTTPLDVAKTLLQTRGTSTDSEIRHCRGMMHAFKIIWQRDGLRGFSRGLTPRVVTHMPSNALCWLSYEFFSYWFASHEYSIITATYIVVAALPSVMLDVMRRDEITELFQMAHSTVLKENKRPPNTTPTSRPKYTHVRALVALATCLIVLSLGNVVRLKFARFRDGTSGTALEDSSPVLRTFSGWTAHPAMTLGLDDPMATIRSRKPSQERSGLLYALELESAQPIGRRDLSAVMTVTHETAGDLELILSTVQQESPGLVEVAIVCPQVILSSVRQALQKTISSFPTGAHLELSLHTWTSNMDEAEALISTASRLATGWILIIDHHHLRGLGAEERLKLFRPWSVSFPLGPRGFREVAPEDKLCLPPSDSPQVASFLVPPFVLPAYVLNGDGISSQKSWPSLGSRIAESRPDSVGGVVLAITPGSGPVHNWCDTQHNDAQHILARHHSSDSNYHQRFFGSSLNPSPTKKDRGTFALVLPTVDDMLYFSTASCRLLSRGNRIHILLYAEEQEELGTESFDIEIGVAFEDGVISTDSCDLRYQVSSVTDVAIDFIITSWLDSLPHPPDIIIGATDEEKLTTYSFQGLKQKKHFYPTLIQLPRADLPYSDWMGVLSVEEWRHWNVPQVDVSIITDNRPGSLARLLDSITNARYFGDTLNLRVNMEQTADPDTLELIGNLAWNHGTVFVHHRVIHGGLLPSVVESWYPLSNDSYGLLLEDDVEASPLFYAWVKLTILRYRFASPLYRDSYL
ncbi:hypothetical protein EVG20_g9093 [Dentipellis fragilis]|uniref:Uncharacterized protein n=1 Tax=Dentipellis fragilis TaxID=205917 RepID=A0A4Y9Y3P4_9AGAM|nr:hypothetical protein EVG20_g9093 [Dentipellis fragilis]